MNITTIRISKKEIINELKKLRIHPRQPIEEIIEMLIKEFKKK